MIRWWDKHGLQAILAVVALGATGAIGQTRGWAIAEIYYFLVTPFHSQRQLLLEDRLINARILELEQRNTELEQQNRKFKQLLDYSDSQATESITAPVIGRNADRWWHQVTLGRGSKQGIKAGYVVMGIGGVVGRVIEVTPHTSRVLLISDPLSRVGVTLSRNRQLGYIQGKDDKTVVMRFFTKVTDIKPGDAIATSALSSLYPSGLPIGTVKSVQTNDSPAPEAEITLTAPIELLEWVTVRPFQPKLSTP
ncbi:MAG: rod shape-determining protein MreC [Pleurocapsa sp.]